MRRGQDRLPHSLRPIGRGAAPTPEKTGGLPTRDKRDHESRGRRSQMGQPTASAHLAETAPSETEDAGKQLPEPARASNVGVDQSLEPVRIARIVAAKRRTEARGPGALERLLHTSS